MIHLSTTPSATTVTVAGDLDVCEREHFPGLVTRVEQLRRPVLVLDLCASGFLDSTGAVLLMTLAERVRGRGGVAVLRGADDRCLFVLDVVGALDLLRVDEVHYCAPAPADPTTTSVLDGAGIETPVVFVEARSRRHLTP